MKNLLAVLLVLSMLLALAACGAAPAADTAPAEETVVEEAPAEESYDPMVDCIQMDNDEGALTFLRVEPAHEALTEEENDYVFVFDFTNKMSKPDQCQTVFQIQFFQNGVELTNNTSWWSDGGEQYDLCGAYFNDVMQGGTVTFGRIVIAEDNSPITVMVTYKNGGEDDYQMMEVALDAAPAEDASAASDIPAEAIEEQLKGTWSLPGGSFSFDNGDTTVLLGTSVISGTYTINTADCTIDASYQAVDGTVSIHLPYTCDDGVLCLYNNDGQALTKE